MFSAETYISRRAELKSQVESGLVVLLGNEDSPSNYTDNIYPFRQDSSFLYYFGIDKPGLAAVIDIDGGSEYIFGDDLTVEQIVWTGPQPLLRELALQVGVSEARNSEELKTVVQAAMSAGRSIHILPQYRTANKMKLGVLLGIPAEQVNSKVSEELVKAVIAQRSIKSVEEIEQIELALEGAYEMVTTAMRVTQPGMYEREVAGIIEGIAVKNSGRLSFPVIFTVHGETLHNLEYKNLMREGDIIVCDCGSETELHYASDVTRTIPVSGKFTARQQEIYSIVFDSQKVAIEAVRPGVEFRDVHRIACVELLKGLKSLGLVKGDPDEGVAAGAHTLFFQCGLGHMMGLDVHDMEGLGEDYVGYTEDIKRNPAFGWRSLRLAKALEPGYVITIEPGIYFIPQLIERFEAENKFTDFVDYSKVREYIGFGGVRIEDDFLVTEDGCRLLGKKIPGSIEEVHGMCSEK